MQPHQYSSVERVMNKEELAKLDADVAEALGFKRHNSFYYGKTNIRWKAVDEFHPSINGQQAMDLLREYNMSIEYDHLGTWSADAIPVRTGPIRIFTGQGPTPEIAICKAVVATKRSEVK